MARRKVDSKTNRKSCPKEDVFMSFDESNHGVFPEIFAGVFSHYLEDIVEGYYGKKSDVNDFTKDISDRFYSFLSVEKHDYERLSKWEFNGIVLASLINGSVGDEVRNLYIYKDGHLGPDKLNYARDIISEYLGFDKSSVNIYCGDNFDIKYPLVNMADEVARWICSNGSPKWQQRHRKHKKKFLK